MFCQPPVGTVGLTEEEAAEALSGDIDVYTARFRALKHTLTGRQVRGQHLRTVGKHWSQPPAHPCGRCSSVAFVRWGGRRRLLVSGIWWPLRARGGINYLKHAHTINA